MLQRALPVGASGFMLRLLESTVSRVMVGARTSVFFLVVPSLYVVLGFLSIFTRGYEVFPFFCWFLFPLTPNTVQRYGLELQQHSGVPLAEATLYEWWPGSGEARNSMDLQVAVQDLGQAIVGDDRPRIDELRRRIEGNFMSAPCAYSVVRESYDPLVLWSEAGPPPVRSIAHFVCFDANQRAR